MAPFTVALIRASLPSYFPERHGVWAAAESTLAEVCEGEGARLVVDPDVPMDARATQAALGRADAEGAGLVLLLHGGFTMGDVSREVALWQGPVGYWAVPEPVLDGDVQLNGFVSLHMSMGLARGVRDLRARPAAWFHGAPSDPSVRTRLGRTVRTLSALTALRGARVGVVGGLAPTFHNLAVDEGALLAALGVAVAQHDIGELQGRMRAQDAARVAAELARMTSAAPVRGVSGEGMGLSARAALALRDIAADGGHAALAVSDWPALQADPGMHPGAAFSWLEEADALPVASEGDVLGAVTQLLARGLTGRLGCLLDLTEPDHAAGKLLVWHGGGGPLHLADSRGAAWIDHPMIGRAPGGAAARRHRRSRLRPRPRHRGARGPPWPGAVPYGRRGSSPGSPRGSWGRGAGSRASASRGRTPRSVTWWRPRWRTGSTTTLCLRGATTRPTGPSSGPGRGWRR
jgi:L-fucose isomerase-like protein